MNTVSSHEKPCEVVVFQGEHLIASGMLSSVVEAAKNVFDQKTGATVVILNAETSEPVSVDLNGTIAEVKERVSTLVSTGEKRGPGRPKLGVIAREITLLPRHWDWLNNQPGGASVALRKLVDEATRGKQTDQAKQIQEVVVRFIKTVAGNRSDFEDAIRALNANDRERFSQIIHTWPADIHAHIERLMNRKQKVNSKAAVAPPQSLAINMSGWVD